MRKSSFPIIFVFALFVRYRHNFSLSQVLLTVMSLLVNDFPFCAVNVRPLLYCKESIHDPDPEDSARLPQVHPEKRDR